MKKYIIGAAVVTALVIGLPLALGGNNKTTDPPAKQGSYVALGDSVAAGVGLKYDSDSSACDRTDQSYPTLTASKLNYQLHNLACSGATLPAGISGKQEVNKLLVSSQLQQLFDLPKPQLITITIGANDAQWTKVLQKCYVAVCGSAEDAADVQTSLATVTSNLQAVLDQLRQHYGATPPPIIVTGYHQVFPMTVSATCTDLTGIDASGLAYGRQLQSSINDSLQVAVKASHASFVPINFSGHELCSSDPWVQGLSDLQPYHPTAAGQAAFSSQIISAVKAAK